MPTTRRITPFLRYLFVFMVILELVLCLSRIVGRTSRCGHHGWVCTA